MLAILTESLLKISQLIGTPRNTFLGNYISISNLCQKYIPIVSCQMFSYAPQIKGRNCGPLFVEHTRRVPFFISLTRKRSLRELGGPPGPLSPSGFAPIHLFLTLLIIFPTLLPIHRQVGFSSCIRLALSRHSRDQSATTDYRIWSVWRPVAVRLSRVCVFYRTIYRMTPVWPVLLYCPC